MTADYVARSSQAEVPVKLMWPKPASFLNALPRREE